jgi:heme-degrading monooxygenase HmoA
MQGYTYSWEFDVPPASQPDFEHASGPDGQWVALFRRAPGYLGTLLLHDRSLQNRYITIDRWRDEAAYRTFRARFANEYRGLDQARKGLASRETPLGTYRE